MYSMAVEADAFVPCYSRKHHKYDKFHMEKG